jgi:iron complex transport system substrate-binding protein
VGTQYIAAVSPPTALSLPWGLDQLVDALAAATK